MAAQTIFLPGKCFGRVPALALVALTVGVCAAAQTNFGSVNLGVSATSTVTLTIPAPATLGSVSVVTQGAAGLDFTNGGGGGCATGTNYGTGQTCTVQVVFKPQYAGPRYGAALLLDGARNVIASAPLVGSGVGAQIAFNPGTAMAISPLVNGVAMNQPFDVAFDGNGDEFFTDMNNGRVVEVPEGGGAPVAIDPMVNGTGLVNPGGVAVDGAGNLYISDLDLNYVVEVPANGAAPIVINPTVNGMQLRYPCGIVVDGAGDLFIADVDNGRVVEVPANGGAAIAIDPLTDGEKLSYPVTLALDSAGDLFIADLFANRIVEVPAGGGTPTAMDPVVNGQGLDLPYGVAVDAAGDLYIADSDNRVVIVPANGGAPMALTPSANGEVLNDPIGIALDPAGDLFVADSLNNRVVEVVRSQAPAVNFAATSPGTTSSDSPKTVGVENIGNAPLVFPSLSAGNNPAITANFTLGNSEASACPVVPANTALTASLAAGAACNLSISFAPAASGATYGALTLTDNNLGNAVPASATQTIPLIGDAPVTSVSATSLSFSSQVVKSASASQQVTLTNTGSATLSISSISVTGANAAAFPFTNSCGSSLAAGANCAIEGTFTPQGVGAMTASIKISDNASNSPQTVSLTGTGVYPATVAVMPSAASITTAQPLGITITVSGATGEPAPTGSVAAAIGNYRSAAATLSGGSATINVPAGSLATGTDNIAAAYTPDTASAGIYAGESGAGSVDVTPALTATAPAATTGMATAITFNSATLGGTVNPNGADTHVMFVYGTNSTLSGATQTSSQDVGSANGTDAVSTNLTGLSANTTYYYQAVAQNSVGAASGLIASFATNPAPYFSMITGPPLSLTPGATSANTSTVMVTPWYGFTGMVNLSCAIAPTAASDPATCSIPASVMITDENAQNATLTIATTAALAMNKRSASPWRTTRGVILACLALLALPTRRRWYAMMCWIVLLVVVAGMGCGGGGSSSTHTGPPPNPGTSAGTYTVTITGVSGGMTETGTVALTVQ